MPRCLPHLLLPACGLVLACCAYALCADAPQPENIKPDAFSGEIILVESKSHSSVAIEQPRIRTIAGLTFVGGAVFFDDSNAASDELVGGRVWIAASEISRLVEFDTKAKFAARREIPNLRRKKAALEQQLRNVRSDSPTHQKLSAELKEVEAIIADKTRP